LRGAVSNCLILFSWLKKQLFIKQKVSHGWELKIDESNSEEPKWEKFPSKDQLNAHKTLVNLYFFNCLSILRILTAQSPSLLPLLLLAMPSKAIIQCSSSSSSQVTRIYDVFVSFRGEDTRNNFTDFLFQAIRRKGFDAFKDDADLRKGESIAPELQQAIEGSRVFIVVFSKNYASSTWCLRELAHICYLVETPGRHVLPIFYDVDPSDVRKQSGYYEKPFVEFEERFREDNEGMEEVQRWREALTQVANLSGWDIRNR